MRRRSVWLARVVIGVGVWGWLAAPVLAQRTTREGVARGAKLFQAECAGCHGAQADGNGVADAEMLPRPRDLTSGKFKLRSTSAQSPATNAELLATITNGIPGTAMPPFRFLSGEERRALVEYVASVAKLPAEDNAAAAVIPPEPAVSPKLLEQGKALYADLGCAACHGEQGAGDGAAGPFLKDEWGSLTPPRNLIAEPMKGGDSNRDVYLRLAVGMPGTAMPAYGDAVSPEQLWPLVLYLQSLRRAPAKPTPADEVALGKELVQEKHCAACHTGTGPRGKGGAVGPPLDVAAHVLDLDWMARFLEHPREAGKIYPGLAYRMPDLELAAPQANAITAYLASLAGRKYPAPTAAPAKADDAVLARGRIVWGEACASCHRLDTEPSTAPFEQQGPSLTDAAARFDYDGVLAYVAAPQKLDPKAVMQPTTLSPADLRAVLDYVWSRSAAVR